MSRLWDKGAPLDERVLRYTAGEDHALDNRLVAYDVEASIAHAGMLHDVGLLDAAALQAICDGLTEIGAAHARGEWTVTLDLEDGQTALETLLTHRIGDAGERLRNPHPWHFRGVAENFHLRYVCPSSLDSFITAYQEAQAQQRSTLFEIIVDGEASVRLFQAASMA